MIKRVLLKAGPHIDAAATEFEPSPVTVFVGPNNSGKSLLLRELQTECQNGRSEGTKVLRTLVFQECAPATANRRIDELVSSTVFSVYHDGRITTPQGTFDRQDLVNCQLNPEGHRRRFASTVLNASTLLLDGTSRLTMLAEKTAGDLHAAPSGTLHKLFRDDELRRRLRDVVAAAFGEHLVIDPTNLGKLRVRFSPAAPNPISQERGIDAAAVAFHRAAVPIESYSDGVRAFSGILAEVLAGSPAVTFIDEPEAFLHPALAFTLGKEIAAIANREKKHLFVSTHSSNFLMGCIQSGAPINIVRLT